VVSGAPLPPLDPLPLFTLPPPPLPALLAPELLPPLAELAKNLLMRFSSTNADCVNGIWLP